MEKIEESIQASTCATNELIRDVKQNVGESEANVNLERKRKSSEQPPTEIFQKRICNNRTEISSYNNFRQVSIVPTADDILRKQKPALEKNKSKGAYHCLDHYIGVQFHLLREDCLQQLIEGIQFHKTQNKSGNKKIFVYMSVSILFSVYNNNGLCYRISTGEKFRDEDTDKLKFGSLLCLSCDNFSTDFIFATVNNADEVLLKNTELEIRLENTSTNLVSKTNRYQMVISPAFFEAYRHVLASLQCIDKNFPFQRLVVYANVDIRLPRHFSSNPVVDLSNLCDRNLLDQSKDKGRPTVNCDKVKLEDPSTWPLCSKLGLNKSQYQALMTALTKELAIVQGPPGTGKTYIGLEIIRVLLKNNVPKPILLVCFTNHALDQFLEGISEFVRTDFIVRAGSRSESNTLSQSTLKHLRRHLTLATSSMKIKTALERQRDLYKEQKTDVYERRNRLKDINHILYFSENGILHEIPLHMFMKEEHFESLHKCQSDTSAILQWLDVEKLLIFKQSKTIDENKIQFSESSTEYDDFEEQIFSDEFSCEKVNLAMYVPAQFYDTEPDENKLKGVNIKYYEQLHNSARKEIIRTSKQAFQEVDDVWFISLSERWMLYRHWVSKYRQHWTSDKAKCESEFEAAVKRCQKHEQMLDGLLMGNAKVLGMTTTTAAKYSQLLEKIGPKIVIVEEAAQVLEAHIITALSSSCEHLILIGDHQQLRPSSAVNVLGKKYNLNLSLFERLINNGIPYVTLTQQHRMRPEISKYLLHIYPELKNHQTVKGIEDILGVSKNCFFLNHDQKEEVDVSSNSFRNRHEEKFMTSFYLYLLKQGYKPSQITVLASYKRQVNAIKSTLKAYIRTETQVTTIDNYQGEENDIILLSLVRSNNAKKIGFIQESNRICVALSRARKGLFVIGNFAMMAEKSPLIKDIIQDAKNAQCYGDSLPLYCQNHKNSKGFRVKSAVDFRNKAPEGGCLKMCNIRLQCTHICPKKCHPCDKDHESIKCRSCRLKRNAWKY